MEIKLISKTNQSSVEATGESFLIHGTVIVNNDDVVESAYGRLLGLDNSEKGSFQYSPESNVNVNMYDRALLANASKDVNDFIDVITAPKTTNLI